MHINSSSRPRVLSALLLAFTICPIVRSQDLADQRPVAILSDRLAGTDAATVDAVASALRRDHFEVRLLSANEVCSPAALAAQRYFLYVIPNATSYPPAGLEALTQYLRAKGNLMVLGAAPFADQPAAAQPLIETISPKYKTYELRDVASLKAATSQSILTSPGGPLPVPVKARSSYARPEGKGFERAYHWRYIPLIKAFDREGVERGTVTWMLLQHAPLDEGPAFADAVRRLVHDEAARQALGTDGTVYAVCAITDPAALQEIARTGVLGAMARRIREGLFLTHGGSEHFSYWPQERVRLGATAVNRGLRKAAVSVRVLVRRQDSQEPLFEKESTVALAPGQSATAAFEWSAPEFHGQTYTVTAELIHDGKRIDSITHELGMLSPAKPSRDAFVTVRNGDFWAGGKKYHPVGVNYWPRYAAAVEQEDYAYHWLSPGFYNPEEIERDLKLLETMGANFIAIRANHRTDRRTVLDFLRRCGHHGMKVFVFVQSHLITDDPHYFQGIMMPFHFQEELVADFIRSTRLADNPVLLGWDLIWEPAGWVFSDQVTSYGWKGDPNYVKRWDEDWARWIDDRYGSLANAEVDWGISARTLDGQVTAPASSQLRDDGPWRVMVAAYRRFMDDLMSRKWNDTTHTLRRLDPNHLISFRQGNLSAIDFTLTATPKHVDFFSMEGHNFKPNQPEGADAAGFTNRYLHYATNGKPYFWIEFTNDVWNLAEMRPDERRFAYQSDCHELIYRMGLLNGASGGAPWWFMGGYRVNEKNDQGIINPDGTSRPSATLLQRYAAEFNRPRTDPAPGVWFDYDRDTHAGGLLQVAFHAGAQAYKQAAAAGQRLDIRTAGTGTNSANTPLVAVGGTACNGHNPPKYLNAEFNWFRIRFAGASGWIEVRDGDRIRVPRNQPLYAEASVGNLEEATWLTAESSQGKPGAAYLAATPASGLKLKIPVTRNTARFEDADFGGSFLFSAGVAVRTQVELQMTAEGRAWFGEKLRITIEPH